MLKRIISSLGWAALLVSPMAAQTYWSSVVPNCSSLYFGATAVAITNAGTTVGYSCVMSSTFVWYSAGGGWGSSIRVAAPSTGAIGVQYTFFDNSGNAVNLDYQPSGGSPVLGTNRYGVALYANQPSSFNLFGLSTNAPGYSTTATGTVYVTYYCPDAVTCASTNPQLLYSALPTYPWSLSILAAADTNLAYAWSAEGIDDGAANKVALVIYNESTAASTFNVRVFDRTGALVASAATPSIPGLINLGGGNWGEGGTWASPTLLRGMIPNLPAGVFKVLVDGGTTLCAVALLQFNGLSATTLQVSPDAPVVVGDVPATSLKPVVARRASSTVLAFPGFAQ